MKKALALLFFGAAALYSQTTASIGGTTYTLTPHPRMLIGGPGSALDVRIKDPDGSGPLVSPKATNTNPAWVSLRNAVAAALPTYQNLASQYWLRDGSAAMQFAAYWYADNSQTAAHDAALYMLRHIEYYVPLACIETQTDCLGQSGASLTNFGTAYWLPNWMLAYELMRGELSAPDRQTFADKMLNDNAYWGGVDGSPGTSCTNPTVNTGANVVISNEQWTVSGGTLAVSITGNAVVNATINTSTSGMNVGDYVKLTGGVDAGFGNNTYPILSVNGPNSISFGYTGNLPNGDRTAANPSLVLTYMVPYAIASSPVFGSAVNIGDWVFTPTNSANLGVVTTILDSSHAYLAGGTISAVASEAMYSLPRNWAPGNCGAAWVSKHYSWTAQVLTNNGSSLLYPPDGGVNGLDPGHNLIYSQLWGLHMVFLSLLDDDANSAVRSGAELTTAANWWFANPYAFAKRFWTGFHQSGSGYGLYRAQLFMPGTAMALETSLVNAPDLMGGGWAKNVMVSDYANAFPGAPNAQMQWGQPDVSGAQMSSQNMEGFAMMAYWFRNTPEGAYANWWLLNIWAAANSGFGNAPGSNLGFTSSNINNSAPAWFFIFTDTAYPVTTLSGAPTTFLFNATDTGSAGQRADGMISRTGFLSAADTLLDFHAETIPEFDHNVFANQPSNYGSYKIFKGHYLLAEEYNYDFGNPGTSGFTIGGTGSNYVEIGGSQANVLPNPTPIPSAIPRAAGTNSYAYAMADVSQVYVAGMKVQHAYRHLADFKAPGTQQFILDYMDFATSAGEVKKAYYHYPNLSSTSLTGTVVTSNNSNGSASQLLTQVLTPQPVLIAANTAGSSFRLDICPSLDGVTCDSTNTQAEMMVVHMPAAGSNNTLPNIALLQTVDPHFAGVEIDGAAPKIALFPRQGKTYTSATFTASHSGTAQILISGITPSSQNGQVYTLLQNGTPVASNMTVGADTTIYYEGTAGAYQVAAVAGPPKIDASLLPGGGQYMQYGQSLACVGGTGAIVWTIGSGSLPAGLSLDPALGLISGIPTVSGTSTFTVVATDALGETDQEPFSIYLAAAAPLQITVSSLEQGRAGIPYMAQLTAAGGGGPYTWSLTSGTSLPAGLSLSASGTVSGIPVAASTSLLQVQAADGFGNTATQQLTLNVVLLPATYIRSTALSGAVVVR